VCFRKNNVENGCMDTRSVELDKKKQNIGTLYIKRRLRPQATCRVDTVEEAHFYAPQ
jgi:hypothetical protein